MLFRYLVARWRHPSLKPFIRAGLGLQRRAGYQSAFWPEHLSRTRAAQARWAAAFACKNSVLTVLGAGPLLDFNAFALAPHFQRFRLVDANPLLLADWSRLGIPVEPVITDVTNCLEPWCRKVSGFRGSWDATLSLIRDLAKEPVLAYSSPTDALLSLNLLSQLEVAFHEALEPILQKRFGRGFVIDHERAWWDALRPACQVLVEQHLSAIEATGAKSVLLICDVEYLDYKGRQYSPQRFEPPPVQWTGQRWLAEPGIECETMAALEGIELNHATFGRWMPSYQLLWHESWLWHIAPNGTEDAPHGKIHRVAAFALTVRLPDGQLL